MVFLRHVVVVGAVLVLWPSEAPFATPFVNESATTAFPSAGVSSIVVDGGGDPHISEADIILEDVVYTHKNGDLWTLEYINHTIGQVFWTSLALTGGEDPRIAYHSGGSGE